MPTEFKDLSGKIPVSISENWKTSFHMAIESITSTGRIRHYTPSNNWIAKRWQREYAVKLVDGSECFIWFDYF